MYLYVFTLIIHGMILGRRNVNIDNTNKKYDFINLSHFMFVKIINSNIILNVYKYNSKYIYNFNVIYIFRNTYYNIILLIIMNYNTPCQYVFAFLFLRTFCV